MNKVRIIFLAALLVLSTRAWAWECFFQFPLSDYTIGGYDFGQSTSSGIHMGEDASGGAGTPVYAAGGGVVKHAEIRSGYGLCVIIEHDLPPGDPYGSKSCTLYGHLRDWDKQVSEGQGVSRGQLLGYLGTTLENGGYPPHLHFAVFKNGYSETWIYYGYDGLGDINDCWRPSDFITYDHHQHCSTGANNLRWTGGPAGGRWYRQNLRLSYAVDGTDPLYCRERAGTHDATYQTHSGYFDMNYGGLGWKEFRIDAWNNWGSQSISHPMGWDDQAPNVYWASDCPSRQVWLTGPQRASFRWDDAQSGVKGDVETTYCRWNGGEKLAKYDGYVDIPEGKNTLEVRCEDDSWWDDGNHSGNATTIYGEFWLDTLPPIITVIVNPSSPDGENGWYTSDPTISMSAVDPNGSNGSGVNGEFYTLDGGPEIPFTLPVLVSGDGIHTYSMRATDVAGNSGTTGDQIIKVDTTPPIPYSVYTDAESGSLDTLVATWSCSDPDSGIEEYEYWIGTTPGTDDVCPATSTVNNWAYAVNLNLTPNQNYYFTVRAKNTAGLWSGVITSSPITVIPGNRDSGPSFNSGGVSVTQEARVSTNYRMTDSIGQFVVSASESSNFVIEHGYWHSDIVFPMAATLGLAKKEANATTIQVGSAEKPVIVTSGTSTFVDRFYVQQPDRSSGLAVQYGVVGGPTLVEGDRVWLIGKLDTVNGERVLKFASPTKVDHADPVLPLYMGPPLLGGASFNEWTPGVLDGFGLNNVGLLVKTYGGLVSYRDPQGRFFYVDNGDNLYDGSHYGVRVVCDGFTGGAKLAMPAYGKHIMLTGISSVVMINNQPVRAIRPRRQSDIQIMGF